MGWGIFIVIIIYCKIDVITRFIYIYRVLLLLIINLIMFYFLFNFYLMLLRKDVSILKVAAKLQYTFTAI